MSHVYFSSEVEHPMLLKKKNSKKSSTLSHKKLPVDFQIDGALLIALTIRGIQLSPTCPPINIHRMRGLFKGNRGWHMMFILLEGLHHGMLLAFSWLLDVGKKKKKKKGDNLLSRYQALSLNLLCSRAGMDQLISSWVRLG